VDAQRQQHPEDRGADQNKMAWKGGGPGHDLDYVTATNVTLTNLTSTDVASPMWI
jgi:hypothetical protein